MGCSQGIGEDLYCSVGMYDTLFEILKMFEIEMRVDELAEMFNSPELAGFFIPKERSESKYNVRIECRVYSIILESDNII